MTAIAQRFSLEERVALVTGASGHLGQAVTRALCEAGATVFVNGRNAEKIAALVTEFSAAGHDVRPLCFDIRDDVAVEEAAGLLKNETGRLDILVNNAYGGSSGGVRDARRDEYLTAYDLAVASSARLVAASLDLLEEGARRAGSSSIINIASMYGTVSPDPRIYGEVAPNPPIYGPAKAGLIQWTRYLACHLGPRGIRANSISPGPFPNAATVGSHPAFAKALADRTPLGRIGSPDELGGAVVFLASGAASYITGVNLPVDGGWTAW